MEINFVERQRLGGAAGRRCPLYIDEMGKRAGFVHPESWANEVRGRRREDNFRSLPPLSELGPYYAEGSRGSSSRTRWVASPGWLG